MHDLTDPFCARVAMPISRADDPTHAAIFQLLSRVNHSCAPNALRMEHKGRLRLVALSAIAPGEEIHISYLKSDHLLEPATRRQQRLASWFPTCWCSRCSSPVDDTRCFPCVADGCRGGICRVIKGSDKFAELSACSTCGALPLAPAAESAMRSEAVLLQILQEWEALANSESTADAKNGLAVDPKRVRATLRLASSALGPSHWLGASLRLLAHELLVAAGCYAEAASALAEWCKTWRATFDFPTLRGAWRMERAGDLLAAHGDRRGAIEALVAARCELARLGVTEGMHHASEIESKLRSLLLD